MTTTTPITQFARRVRRRVSLAVRGEAPDTFFDLHDLSSLNRMLAEHGHPPLTADPRFPEQSIDGAARFILGLLAASRSLRRRFPHALSEGPEGAFATRLVSDYATEWGLSRKGIDNLREAFTAGYGARGEKLLDIRFDLCREFPLAVTPAHRGRLLDWFLRCGRETDASLLDLLWHLFAIDETPDRGLAAMYLLKPQWQERVPHALTSFGWGEFKSWLGTELGLNCRWFRRATLEPRYRPWDEIAFLLQARPDLRTTFPMAAAIQGDSNAVLAWVANLNPPGLTPAWHESLAEDIASGLPRRAGINVLSLFRYTSGLQQAAVGVIDALSTQHVRIELRDMPVPHKREVRDRRGLVGLERFDTTLVITGLDTPPLHAYHLAALHPRLETYRIATWWWELEELPEKYLDLGRDVDEIWAPTRFIAKALAGLGKPVETMLPGVSLPEFTPRSKAHFGMSPSKFTFLFAFDMNSRMPRKNPLGLIRAFRLAFRPEEPVELVIKVTPQEEHYPRWWAELRLAASDAGVTILERNLDRSELLALMNAADAYISLHRAEGFGLTLAESMLLAKPTIATGYSGNLDFMNASNSYLVNYEHVKLEKDIDPYPQGATWAEPDVHHAAMLMSRVYEYPAEAKAVGERARADLQALLSVEAAGQRMAARLAEIQAGRRA